MTWAEKRAQCTGFESAATVGYLRYSWPSVRFVQETSDAIGTTSPVMQLWPEWEGYNGEDLPVDAAVLERLDATRSSIRQWLESAPAVAPVDVGEPKNWDYYLSCFKNTVAFIDFVEAQRNQPGLRIEFN